MAAPNSSPSKRQQQRSGHRKRVNLQPRQDEGISSDDSLFAPTQTLDESPEATSRPSRSTSLSLLFSGMSASTRLVLTAESVTGSGGFINPSSVTSQAPSTSASSKESSSSSNTPLVVSLISVLGIVSLILGFLAFRLRSKRARARRGHQLNSPREKPEDDKMEMLESPANRPGTAPRTRSLIQAFPLPPPSDGSRAGSRAGAFSPEATSIYSNSNTVQIEPTNFNDDPFSSVVPARPRKKSATRKPDRRSVVSWFSISSRKKRKDAANANIEWYRSGVDDFEVGFDPDRPPSVQSNPIPINMVERASPLSELSRLAVEKLWTKSSSSRSVASSTVGLAVDSPRHHHLSRDLPRSENGDITEEIP